MDNKDDCPLLILLLIVPYSFPLPAAKAWTDCSTKVRARSLYSPFVRVPAADLRSDYGQICCVLLEQRDPLLDFFQKPVDLLHGDRKFKLLPMRYRLAFSTALRFYPGTINAR